MELDLVDDETTGPFVRYLGLQITERTGDRVEARWTAGEKHHQPFGIVHGGAHAGVVETLASVGASQWWGDRGKVVGVNNNTDFLRAISAGTVYAESEPLHRGRRQQLWIVTIRDEKDRVVARGQVRLQNLDG